MGSLRVACASRERLGAGARVGDGAVPSKHEGCQIVRDFANMGGKIAPTSLAPLSSPVSSPVWWVTWAELGTVWDYDRANSCSEGHVAA